MSRFTKDEHVSENDLLTKNSDQRLLQWLGSGTAENTLKIATILNEKREQFSQQARDQALMLACKSGRKFRVQVLLGGDANFNATDEDGNTPLLLCAERGHVDIAEILITRGADMNVANLKGETALMLSILPARSRAMVNLLVSHLTIKIDMKDNEGTTALLRAIHARDLDTAAMFYTLHMDADAQINFAHYNWNIKKLRKMFTLELFAGFKKYPLVEAANLGVYEVVELMCLSGADVNLPKHGKTALVVSIENRRLDLVELLIKYKADINKVSKKNTLKYTGSALDFALFEEEIECAKLLLSKGAFLDLRKATFTAVTYHNIESLSFLMETYFEQINSILTSKKIKKLLKHWIESNKYKHDHRSLVFEALLKAKNLLELIIRFGGDVNKCNENGETPLYVAAKIGSIDVIRVLVQSGADVNFQHSDGTTPLMEATARRTDDTDEIVQFLIDAKSNLELTDHQGNTALMLAVTRFKNIELFLNAGANVNQQNKQGRSALMLAIHFNREEAFDLLCQQGADVNLSTGGSNNALSSLLSDVFRITEKWPIILLDHGADTSNLPRTIIHTLIFTGQCNIVTKLVCSGLAPVDVTCNELTRFLKSHWPRLETYSPFSSALINNQKRLAGFFARNLFLTHHDVFTLRNDHVLQKYLYDMNYAECLRLLDEVTHRDFSLTELSFKNN
ncbi:unnamed protein product [Lymnaea stagnalis]|uniref:Uncharacterized protein n=1 Tax=Lymnaea stagnalis TaxID=6523 RepID=A0AAV2HMG8_LYMST